MGKIYVSKLTNCNIYVDGGQTLGMAEEISLPEIKFKMAEHKALGMFGSTEFISGIDKMEAKIKWNSFNYDIFVKFANPFTNIKLMIRANHQLFESEGLVDEVPFVTYLSVASKGFPLGNYKQHDNVEFESNLTVYKAKQEFDGQKVMEYDVLSNIYTVNGEDVLAQYRANIGA